MRLESLIIYRVVKSISLAGLKEPSAAFSQVQASAGREPHEHAEPEKEFSEAARSQVHSPAGRARHEHRGPLMVFSAVALAQVH